MKNKIFILSYLPYILLIFISIYYSIFGYTQSTFTGTYVKTLYGIEAFKESLFYDTLSLCIIPIIPFVLIYQIIYIVNYIIKKYKKLNS